MVLHCGGAGVPVNAAVEESRRDGPGRGECQPVADWLMCKVRGHRKHLPFQLGRKSLVVAN